jgi:hypothetical protein
MKKRVSILAAGALLFVAAPSFAQMGISGAPQMNGLWNPVVGAGGTYELTAKGTKSTMTMAVVSKEGDGYWLEDQITGPNGQPAVVQTLVTKNGDQIQMTKIIFQMGGRGPMEMSMSTMQAMAARSGSATPQATSSADFRTSGSLVGSESVTTPAGTFNCQHWKSKDGATEAWISPGVGPWGLVKSTFPDGSMVLTKVFTDAKSHITGTPQDMDSMMNGRGRGGN